MSHTSHAYAKAGVNIDLADSVKSGLKRKVRQTLRPEVLGSIGGFGGLFALDTKKYKKPVLVSSVDGVGTKLKIAVMMRRHDTVGQDLVNHCVNDITVLGAEPLFFLDYIGMGKLEPRIFDKIIDGFVRACKAANCALIGGETAQMPGIYSGGDYDLVGSIVGVVEKDKILDGSRVRVGDALIGIASSGLHTNGYSLAREIIFTKLRANLDDYSSELGCTVGEELLKVHVNYGPAVHALLKKFPGAIHALAHITGGGFPGNIPRVLPAGCKAIIREGTWDVLPVFRLLQSYGGVSDAEMYDVFNMGIGMVLVADAKRAHELLAAIPRLGHKAFCIGEIVGGRPSVDIL
jgi:phosphoribosylformylglycinamidine cyclo-ligase